MSPFSSSRFAVYKIIRYKNTTDNKLKKKNFSWLKNSVHVEPIWFSLDNLALCGRCNYTSMVLHAISKRNSDTLKLFSYERDDFLLFSSKIETSCQQNKQRSDKLEIPCGTKFLRILIFAIFAIFPAIREIKFQQKKKN